jgi:NADH-quinone oxidoreductase subunit E
MPSRQARDTSALGDESDIARALPDDLPAHAPVAEDEAYWREDGGEGTWSDEPYEEPDEFAAADPVGAPIEPAGDAIAMRPAGLAAPRNGIPDNLQRIRGIGQRNEVLLNSLGIFHFGQIAAWTPAEVRWVSAYLSFPERIERDDWIGQATILASGGATGVTKAADRRRARRQQIRESRSGT